MAWSFPSRPAGFVTDEAGLLDSATRSRIEQRLSELEQKTSHEVAVVTLKSLDGRPIEDVAVQLFKDWGLGKKDKNNGVLFLIAPSERRLRIEVGYGLEEILTDARSGRILEESVAPSFRQGRMSEGVWSGVARLADALSGQADPPRRRSRGKSVAQLVFLIILFMVFGRHPLALWYVLLHRGGGRGHHGGWPGGGFGGGGFGGFGGGMSGGGGASRGW